MKTNKNSLLIRLRSLRLSALGMGVLLCVFAALMLQCKSDEVPSPLRERISINEDWRFYKYDSLTVADGLIYDIRPEIIDRRDYRPADEEPTEAVDLEEESGVLKAWIMPTGNEFIEDESQHYIRPDGDPGSDFPFVQTDFDDTSWELLDLPHDWAIDQEFFEGWGAEVGGGMGRLPSHGVAWYRKQLNIPEEDKGKTIFLDIDGAMSYAMVWLNGHLVGGWPYGYASWRVDLTPYIAHGGVNQIAIRVDNPNNSSRWYPGGGIYRNVWLTKTDPVHVGHWGVHVSPQEISDKSANLDVVVSIDNDSKAKASVEAVTEIFELKANGSRVDKAVTSIRYKKTDLAAGEKMELAGSASIANPKLWGPLPTQTPNLYLAVTTIKNNGEAIDQYSTKFGIRSLVFNPDSGLFVNGEHIYLQGVNQHHDLGALGAAFNIRAAERQLELLREMGCNAIRLAHNQPAPELLDLTDKMGFLVVDELYDCWERKKTPHDFHLIFPDWHEQDMRAFIRRDRNHPSIIMWSLGNEVGEQYTDEDGADVARRLNQIAKSEDPTRPTAVSMNFAKPPMPLPGVADISSLNYQGEGIRDAPAYKSFKGITTSPLYPSFHETYPDKMIISSENAAALSSRGDYLFPVFPGVSAPVIDGFGGDPENMYVSAYELYTTPFGSSADKVFGSLEKHPYVGGGFVWSGWDYLGEPTPYYLARSSYFGVIDLAGFKKDRFYLYQAHWRPDYPMAHILPHWNWPGREGMITPVHVFTSGDEAELFLNGESLGRKKKAKYEYRLRWDDVKYQPGELKVVAYKDNEIWAEEVVKTTGEPAKLTLTVDRKEIRADGKDLAFITVSVTDKEGLMIPDADILINFSIEGQGEIVATDNGDPRDMVSFSSHKRKAYNGLALVIVKAKKGSAGAIKVIAEAEGFETSEITLSGK